MTNTNETATLSIWGRLHYAFLSLCSERKAVVFFNSVQIPVDRIRFVVYNIASDV